MFFNIKSLKSALFSIKKSDLVIIFVFFCGFVWFYQNYFIYGRDRLHEYGDTLHHVHQLDYVSEKLSKLRFKEALSLPHYYPRENTLFYSDTLLPQAILLVPFQLFIDNPIALFNLNFLMNSFLCLFSGYLLSKKILKNKFWSLFGAFFLAFNPFLLNHLGHFQLLVVWPIYLILTLVLSYFDLRERSLFSLKKTLLFAISISALFTILLYTSPYLLVIFVPFYAFLSFFYLLSNKNRVSCLNLLVMFFSLFTFVPYLIIMKSTLTEVMPHPSSSFVTHASELTDYLYPYPNRRSRIVDIYWASNKTSGERGFYPPFLLSSLLFLLVFRIKNRSKFNRFLSDPLMKSILLSVVIGFIFSLGPFLQIGNVVTDIKLPGYFLRNLPVFSGMRAMSRWIFLVSFPTTLFFLCIVQRLIPLIRDDKGLMRLLFVLVLLEMLFFIPKPILLKEPNLNWSYAGYLALPKDCSRYNLIELPSNTHIVNRPAAYHKLVFSSTKFHTCNLLNGYASFVPLDYIDMWDTLNSNPIDPSMFLGEYRSSFVKLNKLEFPEEVQEKVSTYYASLFANCDLFFADDFTDMYDCRSFIEELI